jgi:dUTPase
MILNINLQTNKSIEKGVLETPSNKGDAGYDLRSVSSPMINGDLWSEGFYKNIKYIEYETNISIAPEVDELNEYNFFAMLFPRSSISNYNLSLCNSVGVIDSGYRDSVKVRFNYISQPENLYVIKSKNESSSVLLGVDQSKIYQKGDKIAQLYFAKHLHPKIFIKKSLDDSERNLGGFGSTGK